MSEMTRLFLFKRPPCQGKEKGQRSNAGGTLGNGCRFEGVTAPFRMGNKFFKNSSKLKKRLRIEKLTLKISFHSLDSGLRPVIMKLEAHMGKTIKAQKRASKAWKKRNREKSECRDTRTVPGFYPLPCTEEELQKLEGFIAERREALAE